MHALIKVRAKAKMIVIEDEGSSNGTYVNGKRAPSSILREGDVVAIGPYEIAVRSKEDMSKQDDAGDSTNSLELTSVARVLPSAAMTGLLQEVPMTEVLQGIEFNKKSGTLSVSTLDRKTGVMVFAQGMPMYAGFGELKDDDAVLAMIGLRVGSFAISTEIEPGERRMHNSLTRLLLEASRLIDEAEGEAAEAAAAAALADEVEQGFAEFEEPDPGLEPTVQVEPGELKEADLDEEVASLFEDVD